jgi:hypothetical protein
LQTYVSEPQLSGKAGTGMSATNRGGPRVSADNYPTPTWCVQRLLGAVPLPGGEWLEPAVREGANVQAVERGDGTWTRVDVRPEAEQSVAGLVADERLYQGDFLSLTADLQKVGTPAG